MISGVDAVISNVFIASLGTLVKRTGLNRMVTALILCRYNYLINKGCIVITLERVQNC